MNAPVDPRVVALIDYIVGAADRESLFATPDPQYYLGAAGLIDEIVRLFGIDTAEMSRLVDLANEKAGRP